MKIINWFVLLTGLFSSVQASNSPLSEEIKKEKKLSNSLEIPRTSLSNSQGLFNDFDSPKDTSRHADDSLEEEEKSSITSNSPEEKRLFPFDEDLPYIPFSESQTLEKIF